MKKRVFTLFVWTLAFLLVLSGCGECKHEWQEADCLNAKICAKCQVVEGDALGHDWQPATCDVPETCARCGETRGEKLEHVYGQWVLGETDMTRTCLSCNAEETTEIDRELYWKQKLPGHWDFYCLSDETETIYSYEFKDGFLYNNLHVDFENGSWWSNGDTYFDITVEFVEYQEADDIDAYSFTITFTDDGAAQMMYYMEDGEDCRVLMGYDNANYHFVKNQELVDALTGVWATIKDGVITELVLNADRTFTADVAGEVFTGTWHLRSENYYTIGNDIETVYAQAGLDLLYEKDGAPVVKTHTLSLGKTGDNDDDYLPRNGFSVRLTDKSYYVTKSTAEEVEVIRESLRTAPEKVLGQWTSTAVSTYPYGSGESTTVPTSDYTVTFNTDGTFTANLDKDYTGTWMLDKVDYTGSYTVCYYDLKLDGNDTNLYAHISTQDELNIVGSDDSASYSITMKQLTAEQKAQLEAASEKAKTAIIGDWNSHSIYQDGSETTNSSYTVTFHADGTLTTNLEEGTTGTWCLERVNIDTQYNTISYSYDITLEGYNGYPGAYMHNGADLSISLYEESTGRSIYFAPLSAEAQAKTQ